MTPQQILEAFIGLLVAVATVVQISPIKINPWTAIAKAIGRAINADVLAEIKQTSEKLDEHIRIDDERNADMRRAHILRFNNELIREIPHTKEDFIEVLADIDDYEAYCREHKEYKNNRAKHAIANIGRAYDDRLQKHDFF